MCDLFFFFFTSLCQKGNYGNTIVAGDPELSFVTTLTSYLSQRTKHNTLPDKSIAFSSRGRSMVSRDELLESLKSPMLNPEPLKW